MMSKKEKRHLENKRKSRRRRAMKKIKQIAIERGMTIKDVQREIYGDV